MSAIPRLYLDLSLDLYLDQPFAPGQAVPLTEAQAHYLFSVLRLVAGQPVDVFNGRDGEWRAVVQAAGKRGGTLKLQSQQAPQVMSPDLWLVFAPLKKVRTDMLVEKAVELGAARLVPVLTDRTGAERLRHDKMLAHVIEAAEQCGATHVPVVQEAQRLDRLLDRWPTERALIWCDEALARAQSRTRDAAMLPTMPATTLPTMLPKMLPTMPPPMSPTMHPTMPPAPAAILIGPEGGFSPAERARLAALTFAHPVRLGPRILRAETAAMAALTLWQQEQGDWR